MTTTATAAAPPAAFTLPALRDFFAAGGEPAEAIREAYRRIRALDDPGVFITLVDEEQALAAAAELPPPDPARLPLRGVPFAVKDNIDVAGLPTTAACPGFAYAAAETAPAVRRLLDAGAILIGKTNLDQFATGLVGVRTPYPVPRNAIDPALVPGGSSSGSAVAVAGGLVAFALGTDTAGSGRVPAALNNVVGLKPTVGAVPTRGVVPACRSLDCVSVFALTVDDAWEVLTAMAGPDAADPFSRPVALRAAGAEPHPVIGAPREADLDFFGDAAQEAAWRAALELLERMGARLEPIDMTPFRAAAALLYEGPWVAERQAAVGAAIARGPEGLHPVTRDIIAGAERFSASDLFRAQHRLRELKRETEAVWRNISVLALPTTPVSPTLAELEADPLGPNSRCGTWTNFVNLLDLCALAVPGPFRPDGRAAGVTLVAPAGQDGRLAGLGRALHAAAGVPLGALGVALPPQPAALAPAGDDGLIEIVVLGAHLSGLPLNHELTGLGGVFRRAVATQPDYRLHALAGGPPHRPGLLRVGEGEGAAIAAEVWALPAEGFGRFVAGVPAPLSIGTLRLADGATPKGFLVEAAGLAGARDITGFGGWRAYMAALARGEAA